MARYEFFKLGNKTVGYDITIEESIGRDLFSYLLALSLFAIIGAFASSILPLVLFIMYFFTAKKELWLINTLGFIAGFYFIFDYMNGWLCYKLFTEFFEPKTYEWFVTLNIGLILTHFILVLYNIVTFDKPFSDKEISLDAPNFVILLAIICFFTTKILFKNEMLITKYREPIKTEEQIKVEHNQMY